MSDGKVSMPTLLVIVMASGLMQVGLAPQYHSLSLIKPGVESDAPLMQVLGITWLGIFTTGN